MRATGVYVLSCVTARLSIQVHQFLVTKLEQALNKYLILETQY